MVYSSPRFQWVITIIPCGIYLYNEVGGFQFHDGSLYYLDKRRWSHYVPFVISYDTTEGDKLGFRHPSTQQWCIGTVTGLPGRIVPKRKDPNTYQCVSSGKVMLDIGEDEIVIPIALVNSTAHILYPWNRTTNLKST